MKQLTELQKYKYATIALGILVVILLIVLYKGGKTRVTDIYQRVNTRLDNCRVVLEEWKTDHPAGKTLTPEAQTELSGILEDCTQELRASQKAI